MPVFVLLMTDKAAEICQEAKEKMHFFVPTVSILVTANQISGKSRGTILFRSCFHRTGYEGDDFWIKQFVEGEKENCHGEIILGWKRPVLNRERRKKRRLQPLDVVEVENRCQKKQSSSTMNIENLIQATPTKLSRKS